MNLYFSVMKTSSSLTSNSACSMAGVRVVLCVWKAQTERGKYCVDVTHMTLIKLIQKSYCFSSSVVINNLCCRPALGISDIYVKRRQEKMLWGNFCTTHDAWLWQEWHFFTFSWDSIKFFGCERKAALYLSHPEIHSRAPQDHTVLQFMNKIKG